MTNQLKGIFITGTDTGVGKTHVACQLARQLIDEGYTPIPRKPVESGCTFSVEGFEAADAIALKHACDYTKSLSTVCPYPLKAAISPAEAARLENKHIKLEQLVDACRISEDEINQSQNPFLMVEGAGGFYSPLCENALNADLAEQLNLPVLLVADDKLGCINHILLTLEALKARGLSIIAVVLNRINTDSSQLSNLNELQKITTTPLILTVDELTKLFTAPDY